MSEKGTLSTREKKEGPSSNNPARKFNLIEYQNDLLQVTIAPDTDEYFIACHDNAYNLMLKKEFERALLILDEVHDYLRKTDRTSQLGDNLILQATIHLVIE